MTGSIKWHILIGGFLTYMFDAVEISILAISLPALRGELGITIAQSGLLATASWMGIGASGIAMGWVADNFGRRGALLASLVVFGAATFLFAFSSSSYALMLALRFVAGLGLGGVWAILAAFVAETWSPASRGRVTLLVLSSYPVGAAAAAAFAGFLLPDWRSVFVWAGLSAFIPLTYIAIFIPESPTWLESMASRRMLAAQNAQHAPKTSLLEIFRGTLFRQTVLGTAVATFALFAYISVLTWLPSYLTADRGLSVSQVSRYVVTLNFGIFLSYFVFGVVADLIGKRNALVVSFLGVAVMLSVYVMISDLRLLLWSSPVVGVFIVFSGLLGSYFCEVYPIHVRTTGAGFCFNIGRAVASFSPIVTATIAASYGFSAVLGFCAALFMCAALAMMLLPSSEISPQERPLARTFPDIISDADGRDRVVL